MVIDVLQLTRRQGQKRAAEPNQATCVPPLYRYESGGYFFSWAIPDGYNTSSTAEELSDASGLGESCMLDFGLSCITLYPDRYHQLKISRSGGYYVLSGYGLDRLPRNNRRRSSGL